MAHHIAPESLAIELPRRPASAGSPWRNPGRLRMRDIDFLRNSARRGRASRPASAPSGISSTGIGPLRPASAPSVGSATAARRTQDPNVATTRELLVTAYAKRVEDVRVQKPSGQDKTGEQNERRCECSTPLHAVTLRDDVYMGKCSELRVKANSGVLAWLADSNLCTCQLPGGNFKNMLLGNRGVLAVLPLLDCMQSLRSLSLAGNGLRGAGVQAVIAALSSGKMLPQLCVFDLSHNPLSSPSGDSLEPLLNDREDLLFLGLAGTALGSSHRQRLMRHALANFQNAEPSKALEAWHLAASTGFSDLELKARYAVSTEVLQTALIKPVVVADPPVPAQPKLPPGPAPAVRRKAPASMLPKVVAVACPCGRPSCSLLCRPDATIEQSFASGC